MTFSSSDLTKKTFTLHLLTFNFKAVNRNIFCATFYLSLNKKLGAFIGVNNAQEIVLNPATYSLIQA